MTFKPAIWHPIAVVLSGINLAAAGFATGLSEPWHAGAHAALALGLGYWARRLRRGSAESDPPARLEMLEDEVNHLRGELSEAQERLDFTERMLAHGLESRRVGPEP